MKNIILPSVNDRIDYLTVLEAVTEEKTEFSPEEAENLLAIYMKDADQKLGFANEALVKSVLALDVPGANLLDKTDADALTELCTLCADWEPNVEKAGTVKAAALNGAVSQSLALVFARAALDAYAGQNDITAYREDIVSLTKFLKQAEDKAFEDASKFLIRVRERVRTK